MQLLPPTTTERSVDNQFRSGIDDILLSRRSAVDQLANPNKRNHDCAEGEFVQDTLVRAK